MSKLFDNFNLLSSSPVLFNRIIATLSSRAVSSFTAFPDFQKRKFSNNTGYTSLLFYDGLSAQELPLMTRKLYGNGVLHLCCKTDPHKGMCMKGCEDVATYSYGRPCKNPNVGTVLYDLMNTKCSNEVFSLIERLPYNLLCPLVALQALKRIVDIDNNPSSLVKNKDFMDTHFKSTRCMHMNKLINVILTSDSSSILYEAFLTARRDSVLVSNVEYKIKICEEIICRLCEGHYNIIDMCRIIELSSSIVNPSIIDKAWSGFVAKENEIDKSYEIIEVCRMLHHLQDSRSIIVGMLERSALRIWWKFTAGDIIEMIYVLNKNKIFSQQLFAAAVYWMTLNVSLLSEDDLLQITNCFLDSDYFDIKLEKIFIRFLKNTKPTRNDGLCLASIIDYCVKYRIKSDDILEKAAESIIDNGTLMSPYTLKTVFRPIGLFNYVPKNPKKFWSIFEQLIKDKFVHFQPVDILEIIAGCLYSEKQPINFVKSLFNPYFLGRVLQCKDNEVIEMSKYRLKIIDSAMTIDCLEYDGPLLPRDNTLKLWQDSRIKRIVNHIEPVLNSIIGESNRITYSVVPPQLPMVDLYFIDILIHPSRLEKLFMKLSGDSELYTAVLILLPEHYCHQHVHLTGPQKMRQRHLRKLGFQLVTLNYRKLSELRMEPAKLKCYIEDSLKLSGSK